MGVQTALVTGPEGEEIYTDEHGMGEGAVPLGPGRPVRREHHVLHPGGADLGGHGVGRRVAPPDRPRGDRELHRGRPGQAHHHRQRVQRHQHAAVHPAGRQDQEHHQVGIEPGRRRLQRDPLRGQEGRGGGVHPRPEGPQHRGGEQPERHSNRQRLGGRGRQPQPERVGQRDHRGDRQLHQDDPWGRDPPGGAGPRRGRDQRRDPEHPGAAGTVTIESGDERLTARCQPHRGGHGQLQPYRALETWSWRWTPTTRIMPRAAVSAMADADA
ncbi:MAG: hypothetical protein MZV70_53680 [Desulfobacterales bacterium]|nr:hypothetical protein [Desulfobacterales bacterium]